MTTSLPTLHRPWSPVGTARLVAARLIWGLLWIPERGTATLPVSPAESLEPAGG